MLADHRDTVEQSLRPLRRDYGYQIYWKGPDAVSLCARTVRIETFVSDPRYEELGWSLFDTSAQPHEHEFLPVYMMAIRAPNVLAERGRAMKLNEDRKVRESYEEQIQSLVQDLVRWFPDVLAGDFSRLTEVERYDEFVREVEELMLGPLQSVEKNDPIWTKVFSCDFSWISDLKQRLGA